MLQGAISDQVNQHLTRYFPDAANRLPDSGQCGWEYSARGILSKHFGNW